MNTKNRSISLDLLRLLAMLMIVVLHVQGKTGWLRAVPVGQGDWLLRWGLEALSIVAVNCYVLLSGYFLITTPFRMQKVLVLWLRVLFWSVLLALVGWAVGVYAPTRAHALETLLPVTMRTYWFASVYIGFYLLSPFLQLGLSALSRSAHRSLVLVLLLLCSLWQTLLPLAGSEGTFLPLDGNNILWFVTLYCVAAYVRLYRESFRLERAWALPAYLLITGGVLLVQMGAAACETRFGFGGWLGEVSYAYASVPCFLASLALFCAFLRREGRVSERWARRISGLSACTFGVYLIQEHPAVQAALWSWLGRVYPGTAQQPFYVPVVLLISLAIFLACALLERLRILAFSKMEQGIANWKLVRALERWLYPFLPLTPLLPQHAAKELNEGADA